MMVGAFVLASAAGGAELAGFSLNGFLDGRAGIRTQADPHEPDGALGELRAQLSAERIGDAYTATLVADLLYDQIVTSHEVDLETGRGWLDLREANLLFTPTSFADVKLGRQVLTWGVGDMLFINDLFPKDWQSFFGGRDTDYLKAPSDAALLSLYPGPVDIDLVYTPRFDADRYIDGSRNSYWNPMLGRRAGRDAIADPIRPDECFTDDEFAVRLRRTLDGYELAAYGYYGFWKSPEGFEAEAMRATFPPLSVYGASVRGALAGGLLSLETGHYDSRDDRGGGDPGIPNSQQRGLVGYEREIARDLQMGVQYYVEYMFDYDTYRGALPPGQTARDEARQVVTLRLTKLVLGQTLTLSLFGYFSPTDQDAYLRPSAAYKASDNLLLEAGAQGFTGRRPDTFFGQFENDSSVYAAVRYSF